MGPTGPSLAPPSHQCVAMVALLPSLFVGSAGEPTVGKETKQKYKLRNFRKKNAKGIKSDNHEM